MQSMRKNKPQIAACLFSLSPDADGAIQLFPAGDFDAPRGALRGKGPWRLNAESAQRLISAVSQRQNDILIDYEHQSLLTAENGLPVPAAGWFGGAALEWRDAGLFASPVKWTEAAAAHIAADEYRYLSPVFSYDPKTGVVLDIINVALTNNPAIDGMQAVTVAAASFIASTSLTPTESAMDEELLALLCLVLGQPETATTAALSGELVKIKPLLTAADGQTIGLLAALTAKTDEIAALSAQVGTETARINAEPDPAQYAPIGVVNELRTQLAALSTGAADDRVERLIEQGKADGRIIGEKAEAWLTDMGKKDFAALSGYLDAVQPIAALSGMQSAGKTPADTNTAALSATADEQAVAKQLGLSHEEIVKQRSTK